MGREWEWEERVHLRQTRGLVELLHGRATHPQLLKCPESSLMKSENVNSNLSSPTRNGYCYSRF